MITFVAGLTIGILIGEVWGWNRRGKHPSQTLFKICPDCKITENGFTGHQEKAILAEIKDAKANGDQFESVKEMHDTIIFGNKMS